MAVAFTVPQETTLPHLRGTSVGMNCSLEGSKAWVERTSGLVENACRQRCRAGGGFARLPSPAICWVDKRITVGGMAVSKECFQGEKREKQQMQDHSVLMLSPGQHAPGHYNYTITISQKPVEFGRLQGLCHHNYVTSYKCHQRLAFGNVKKVQNSQTFIWPPLPRVKAFKWKLLEISNV